ncbi:LLM class flavin-dependent oxidoreductase [Luteipulveratus flavus]|uniref:LLM class flavin-dependent oxidoreductase n=1 Tax=Luteipulveratus flavus TaxID=3031728 RepID=A0ABT6C4C9_9MICO|nr:LLM class flavin-dependent oxidoreductase [Luteipulveratus sp. YIM 133296]MDF8263678.1 LLM class flavin-dependent oxidoreductase [Luteipulveratus sp. YIM 133296]
MADYGHDLRFGIFPSPAAANLPRTLDLAALADREGLDLVAVQDHPYLAAHADTWTTLCAIAARTGQIHVAPDVVSLPLRPPVVLAKAAATLDLISDGRVELGLGTGAYWDGIVKAGGERRTPKEAVDALVEAVEIIRGVWSGERITVEGEHYRVPGLHGGPMPAHPIPVAIGSYGPRMLGVTGRLADAWLPTSGYADPSVLADMNARIDDAAQDAGRDPGDIVRWYNLMGEFGTSPEPFKGTPQDWVEQLAELAIEDGMSTFVLGLDDPDDVRRLAREVAPGVRDLVAQERASH